MFQNMDASTKMPDSPMVDEFLQDDDLESIHSEQEFDIETTHLVTHTKVYAIAEKYVPPSFHSLLFVCAHPCLLRLLSSAVADSLVLAMTGCIAALSNTDIPRYLRHHHDPHYQLQR